MFTANSIVKYRHTIVYAIRGIHLPGGENDKNIIIDSSKNFRAILTCNPDAYCFEDDRKSAVANLIINKQFDDVETEALTEYIARVVEKIKQLRKKKFSNCPYLVLIKEGIAENFLQSYEKELEEFVVCFDEIEEEDVQEYKLEEEVRASSKPYIFTSLSALMVATGNPISGIGNACDSIIYFREDDKPVYSYIFWTSVDAFLSFGIDENKFESTKDLYQILISDRELYRVSQLLVSSFETKDDNFRSFIFAWTALEIFINKKFGFYEKQFFQELNNGDYPQARYRYLERIRTVMKDKYRLSDKFALITYLLSPKDADKAIQMFEEAKKERDKLSHGQDFDEPNLPVYSIQLLVQKYLQLHLTAS